MRIHLRTHDAQPSLLEWSPRARAVEPAAIVEEESPRINGITIGDVINLDGVEVEVMGIDRDGFIWRTVDTSREAVDDGDVAWNEVVHITLDVWSTHTKPVEAPPPTTPRAPRVRSRRMRDVSTAQDAAYLRSVERLARLQLRVSTFPLHQWRWRFSPGLWGTPRRNRNRNRK